MLVAQPLKKGLEESLKLPAVHFIDFINPHAAVILNPPFPGVLVPFSLPLPLPLLPFRAVPLRLKPSLLLLLPALLLVPPL